MASTFTTEMAVKQTRLLVDYVTDAYGTNPRVNICLADSGSVG